MLVLLNTEDTYSMCSLQLCHYVKIHYSTQSISNTVCICTSTQVNSHLLTTVYTTHVHNVTDMTCTLVS